MDIDSLIVKFREDELILHNGFDYGRFRVFIDSCLLLLNNEKLKVYCKNKYRFKDFFDELEQDDELKSYLEFIKNEKLTSNISGVHLFYSLQGDEKTPWEQVSTIRKAMAHMQYGYFMSQPSGMMTYYNIYIIKIREFVWTGKLYSSLSFFHLYIDFLVIIAMACC